MLITNEHNAFVILCKGGGESPRTHESPEQVLDCLTALGTGRQFLEDCTLLLSGGVTLIQPCLQFERGQFGEGGGDGSVEHGAVAVCFGSVGEKGAGVNPPP